MSQFFYPTPYGPASNHRPNGHDQRWITCRSAATWKTVRRTNVVEARLRLRESNEPSTSTERIPGAKSSELTHSRRLQPLESQPSRFPADHANKMLPLSSASICVIRGLPPLELLRSVGILWTRSRSLVKLPGYAVGILLCPAAGLKSCGNTGLDWTFQPGRGLGPLCSIRERIRLGKTHRNAYNGFCENKL